MLASAAEAHIDGKDFFFFLWQFLLNAAEPT